MQSEISIAPERSEEHTSELQSHHDLVCRLLLEKKKIACIEQLGCQIASETEGQRAIADGAGEADAIGYIRREQHRVARGADDFFFFNDTATTEIYTLSLHDALPI